MRDGKNPKTSGFVSGEDCWSRRGDSNSRPTVYETVALPLSYVGTKDEGSKRSADPVKPARGRRTGLADGYCPQHLRVDVAVVLEGPRLVEPAAVLLTLVAGPGGEETIV
jgi:hypothetical protein